MGLFGHKGGLSKLGHKIGHTLKHYDKVLRSHNAPDMYIGATYGENGINPNIKVSQSSYTDVQNTKPTAYTANAAATASSIKQGGMTKKEVQEFNIKHPNETALRS